MEFEQSVAAGGRVQDGRHAERPVDVEDWFLKQLNKLVCIQLFVLAFLLASQQENAASISL